MSFVRSAASKNNSTSIVEPSLSCLPKLPPRPSSKPPTFPSNISKIERKVQLSSIPNQDDLDEIVNNLSTIVERSEQSLTPTKSSHTTTNVRRTASLHINNQRNFSNTFIKISNSHHEILTNSNLDLSRLNIQRHSLHKIEKFSGIKCSLPSGTSTIPNTFKGLEKHTTPTKIKQMNISLSLIDNQITPTMTNGKVKSPWRLRFEKFLNHEELTPLSPTNDLIAFKPAKTSSLSKENGTPSFRLPTRRTSKIHLISEQNE
ncbi:unnamed protein product [Rotaria sordida]|uniref:Uncharacterized protein n=1 Tax=Rotaria sordida TaxID=392033 RepID=A0A818TJ35_9BILA|nr:unnamed protein product [Rotaria sordida]